ncbi:unnamed protein product [Polarella glacialis]|uniref:Choline transporter-like protein n=1 Tax=Polarella glacialis TaxID=89957 RepID=A0A813G085_POLGL|nr:unnamed protein product [Polarella glacialis]CAE8619560.1 unnamed protein product [Polarella glacialis]
MNDAMTAGSLNLKLKDPICVASCPGSANAVGPLYPPETECARVTGSQGIQAYKTMVMLDKYCMPDSDLFQSAADSISSSQSSEQSQKLIEDLSSIPAAWPVLLSAFFLAIVLGYIYLLMLRHCAEVLIWVTIALVMLGFTGVGLYCIVNAETLAQHLPAKVRAPEGYGDKEATAARVLGGICIAVAFICGTIACCMRTSIDAACACVEVAVDAMFEMPSLLLAPILKAVGKGIMALILLYGFFALLSTAPMTSPLMDPDSQNSVAGQVVTDHVQGVYRHFTLTTQQKVILVAYVFVSFWIECFLNALYQFIIGYAMAEYYYAPYDHDGEKDVGCCALFDGLHVGLLYHCGSPAFGSALVAAFSTLQMIIAAIEYQNQATGQSNRVVDAILGCLQSLVTCFKWIVELINRNAYVDIAITSNNFCDAAKSAIAMIIQLGGSMAVLNGATIVFSVFGSLLIGIACAAFSFFLTTSETFTAQSSSFQVTNPVPVAVVSGFIGVSVAACFMLVFDMASDALLYCYGIDLHTGRGSSTAPPALKDLVHNQGHGEK